MTFHPLHTDIERPRRFTYPFCYEPHPLSLMAAEAVQQELGGMTLTEGKMFGVLVCEQPDGTLGFLAAYSGLLEGRNDWPYFVPPVFDAQQPDGYFKQKEREISLIAHAASPSSPLTSKQMSQELQLWLFHQYRFLNARGEERDLVSVWQDYHCSARIRRRYPLPPGGTGDCCAPKLLQHAYRQGLRPVCMAEFWWGASPKGERLRAGGDESGMVRHHGHFYPACRGKCKPVLTWMLQGLDVEPNPEEAGFPRLIPEIVYEDEAMAVLNKPSGLLSIPGRTEDHSVATWAQQRWPGAILAHRLDLWTSGLIVVAKTREAHYQLQQQFVRRTIRKRYIAVVSGTVKTADGTPAPVGYRGRIQLPLLSDPMNRPRQVVDYQRGKTAVTEYEILNIVSPPPFGGGMGGGFEKAPGNQLAPLPLEGGWGEAVGLSLLALYPHTGRTHQLRVHCAHPDGLGCPIVGDELYGRAKQTQGGVCEQRLCLHADRLQLAHPVTGGAMSFSLPYPFDNLVPYSNK